MYDPQPYNRPLFLTCLIVLCLTLSSWGVGHAANRNALFLNGAPVTVKHFADNPGALHSTGWKICGK